MPKVLRGRAGREDRRSDQIDTYGAELAQLLLGQLRPRPADHILHLGNPGVIPLVTNLAPRVPSGSITALVYSYDELVATQAALAAFEQVIVANEWAEIDPLVRFDLITSVVPYHLGVAYVEQILTVALQQLKPTGGLLIAGDQYHEFDRYLGLLRTLVTGMQTVATSGQNRVVQVEARAVKRKGGLVKRSGQ
ncbi:MAG: methyltransferase [Herpetosiphonaceae bacterium]|nr:methyltransferase [Herpetosiphonaceae bacterium]